MDLTELKKDKEWSDLLFLVFTKTPKKIKSKLVFLAAFVNKTELQNTILKNLYSVAFG